MLDEILKTLKRHCEYNKVPNKVPNKTTARVIELLIQSPRSTADNIAAELGISARAVRKIITSLKECGVVERVGSNKTGYWKVDAAKLGNNFELS